MKQHALVPRSVLVDHCLGGHPRLVAEWHTVTGWLADWREARSARTCTTHWPRRSGQCTWGCAGCAAPSCRARWPRGPSLRAHPPRRSGISLRSSSVASWTCRGSCSSARRRSACWPPAHWPPARWPLARWPPRRCVWRTTAPWRTTDHASMEQQLRSERSSVTLSVFCSRPESHQKGIKKASK